MFVRLLIDRWDRRVFVCLLSFSRLKAINLVFVDGVQDSAFGDGGFAVHGLADDGVAGQIVEELGGGPLHSRELGEAGVEVGLVDGCGVQLLVEPFIEAYGADGFEVAGAGAEGETIEGVEDALVALKLGGFVIDSFRGLCGRLVAEPGGLLRVAHGDGGAKGGAQNEGQRAS